MTRDYAKNSRSNKRRHKKSRKSYLKLWLITIILFGFFIIGLAFFGKHEKQPIQHPIRVPTKSTKTTNTKPLPNKLLTIKSPSNKPKIVTKPITIEDKKTAIPEFDFYRMLPSTNGKSSNITAYELLIATTNDYATADHLKAQMSLLGFEVNITPIKTNDSLTYRVTIGPYQSKEGAEADQQRLQQNKIRSILRKS